MGIAMRALPCLSLGGLLFLLLLFEPSIDAAAALHNVTVESPKQASVGTLYPTSLDWDDSRGTFILGFASSLHLLSVSDTGITKNFLDIQSADQGSGTSFSVLDIKIDPWNNNRILAVLHSFHESQIPFDALAAYDISSKQKLFLATLHDVLHPAPVMVSESRPMAHRVCVDHLGNAYVSDSTRNLVWKVDPDSMPSVFSSSSLFLSHHPRTMVEDHSSLQGEEQFHSPDYPLRVGLNGIAYAPPGYLLLGQSDSGFLFKLSLHDSSVRIIECGQLFRGIDGIELRGDGALVLVSSKTIWVLKSQDSWDTAQVVDTLPLDPALSALAVDVAFREGQKPYILHSYVHELFTGKELIEDRKVFFIQEVDFPSDQDDPRWIALGIIILLIFIFVWKFQMNYFFKQYTKKRI